MSITCVIGKTDPSRLSFLKKEPFYTVYGNVNWYSHYGEQYGGSLKNKKIELPYDPAIPLLGIYLEKTLIEKDI